MEEQLRKVTEFMLASNQPISFNLAVHTDKLRNFRSKLIIEEADEFVDAAYKMNIYEMADALGDLLYVIYGAALTFGIPLEAVFNEIHRSNMTKVVDGKVIRREDGKVMKPESYEPPNIKSIIDKYK